MIGNTDCMIHAVLLLRSDNGREAEEDTGTGCQST